MHLSPEKQNQPFSFSSSEAVLLFRMGRKYTRKTDPVDKEGLQMAIALYRSQHGEMSYTEAARTFEISTATLIRHEKNLVHPRAVQGRFLCVFTEAQEQEIVEYLFLANERFYGCTRFMLAQKAFQFAEANNVASPPAWQERRCAGIEWVMGFLDRHKNVSVRTSTQLNLARVLGFTRRNVDKFFDNLESVLGQFPAVGPSHIFNMDETGMTIIPRKAPKVLARKGSRGCYTISHGERGKLVTLVACFNASGSIFIPPLFVFPNSVVPTQQQMDLGPMGSIAKKSKKGWSTAQIFLEWLHHFNTYVETSNEAPAILVLDNHSTHVNLEAVEFCLANNIHMVTLPPHTSDRMQPLDIGFFSPLKGKYSAAMYNWICQNRGKRPQEWEIPKIIKESYDSLCYQELAVNSFNKCGIWSPILHKPNRRVFSDSDFQNAELHRLGHISPGNDGRVDGTPVDPSPPPSPPQGGGIGLGPSPTDDADSTARDRGFGRDSPMEQSSDASNPLDNDGPLNSPADFPSFNVFQNQPHHHQTSEFCLDLSLIPEPEINEEEMLPEIILEPPPQFCSAPTSEVSEIGINSVIGISSTSSTASFISANHDYSLVEKRDFESRYDELIHDFGVEFSQAELEEALNQPGTSSKPLVLRRGVKRPRDETTKFEIPPLTLDPDVAAVPPPSARAQSSVVLTSEAFLKELEDKEIRKQEASMKKDMKRNK